MYLIIILVNVSKYLKMFLQKSKNSACVNIILTVVIVTFLLLFASLRRRLNKEETSFSLTTS